MKKKKIFSKILIIFAFVVLALIVSFSIVFIKTTYGVSLDEEKLLKQTASTNVKLYDLFNNEIDSSFMFSSDAYIDVDSLPDYVKKAFIVTEDKRFYKHNGVDYYRTLGALVNNLKTGRNSQGGSTITQQLIKNTHLSREKTLERKLKEIKLAYKLENNFSKDEILEMYLNNIYFGNGCYGLEKAARFYFDKQAKDLSIGEAAMLVATINAPSVYDPINKNENAEQRKKLVLKLMLKNDIITQEEYEKNANSVESIVKTASKTSNQYIKSVLTEACEKLNVTENQFKNMNVEVYTSLNSSLQNHIQKIVLSSNYIKKNDNNKTPLSGILILDNNTKNVVAFASNRNINLNNLKRQPGSTIKPILVYAPAFENGKLYPESIIIDEKININGYSPNNANKTFLGAVSVRESIEKSLNVPAVKTLSLVGVNRAKSYAENMGISFSSSDQNLALALGGMTNGITLKQLADAYSTFATSGNYKESGFITKIVDKDNNILYENNNRNRKVFSDATAYLITDVLKGVSEKGTARRLNSLNYDVASKTGTVGVINSNKNTDAFNVAYTKDYTIVSWIGAYNESEYLSPSVNGSNYPTAMSKAVLQSIYGNSIPNEFTKPESITEEFIDIRSLKNNTVELATNQVEPRYKKLALFNEKYLPKKSEFLNPHNVKLVIDMEEGEKPTIVFDTIENNEYKIMRENLKTKEQTELSQIAGKEETIRFIDSSALSGDIYQYYVISSCNGFNDVKISNNVKLMSY